MHGKTCTPTLVAGGLYAAGSSCVHRFQKSDHVYHGIVSRALDGHPVNGSMSCLSSSSDRAVVVNELQDRLKKALLAEAEEEQHSLEMMLNGRTLREKKGIFMGDVSVSPQGRMYSELVWSVRSRDGRQGSQNFKQGNTVFLLQGQRGGKISLSSCIEGTILGSQDGNVLVTVKSEDSSTLSKWSSMGATIDIVMGNRTVSLDRQLTAVESLSSRMEGDRKGARALRAILLGSPRCVELAARAPDWMASPYNVQSAKQALSDLKNLNASQKRAIVSALTRSMTLWQGPPGTGKTRTLLGLAYVLRSLSNQSMNQKYKIGKILAIAETNAAADNLLAGMDILGLKAVRVGPVSKVRPDLRHLSWEAQAEATRLGQRAAKMRDKSTSMAIEARNLRDSNVLGAKTRASQLEFDSQRLWKSASIEMNASMDAVMVECEVVVTTCISAGDKKLSEHDFRVVIIDEATQATEPSTLISLTRGTECVVMAGDHRQLPPTVISKKAEKLGLDISMFARMQSLGIESHLLQIQYRMHPLISEFPSQEFYSGKVSTGIPESSRPPIRALNGEQEFGPVSFVHCDDFERRVRVQGEGSSSSDQGSVSYSNQGQCDIAMNILDAVHSDPSIKHCALLTPYNGHLDLMRRQLPDKYKILVESGQLFLSTIDGFQGREADVVIFCTVRSNDRGSLGFLKDPRRMNVAITRARRSLIVIGSRETLMNDQTWKRWVEWISVVHQN